MGAAQRAVRGQRGEVTRRQILERAALLFAEKGYAGTTFADLIEATGLTKGAFYFHFPSKEALALEVFAFEQERWAQTLTAATDASAPALEQLTAMLWAACDRHETSPSARCAARLCFELGEDPKLRPRLNPFVTMWEDLIAAYLLAAQREGDVRPDLDVRAAARVSVAAWMGISDVSWVVSNGADQRERAREFMEVFLAGVRPADRGRKARG